MSTPVLGNSSNGAGGGAAPVMFILKDTEIIRALAPVSKDIIVQCLRSVNQLYKLTVDESIEKVPKQKLLHVIQECICFAGIDDFIASINPQSYTKLLPLLGPQAAALSSHPHLLQGDNNNNKDEDAGVIHEKDEHILSFLQQLSSWVKRRGINWLLDASDLALKHEFCDALHLEHASATDTLSESITLINDCIKDEIILRGTESFLRNIKAPIIKAMAECLKINRMASKEVLIDKILETMFGFKQTDGGVETSAVTVATAAASYTPQTVVATSHGDHSPSPKTTPSKPKLPTLKVKIPIDIKAKLLQQQAAQALAQSQTQPQPPQQQLQLQQGLNLLGKTKRIKKPNQKYGDYLDSDSKVLEAEVEAYEAAEVEYRPQTPKKRGGGGGATKRKQIVYEEEEEEEEEEVVEEPENEEEEEVEDVDGDDNSDGGGGEEEEDEQDGDDDEEVSTKKKYIRKPVPPSIHPISLIVKGITKAELHTLFHAPDLRRYCKLNGLKSSGNKKVIMRRIEAFLERESTTPSSTSTPGSSSPNAQNKKRKKTKR
ncbi:hypothetical protein SAMD00019534_047750 [Acytostelium subglobosum LB1]|uniref:hypothetical protein n=1 Tax=Acytostelium subglobosum LB1 TaxID=1410327 RepID=UPI0006449D18|nr:hypothetical protein SAMD00019534_047750 [Acytostelium subglobosum LB1]GAM21600.1 hypothetical protein SAMD00019534_047750 [Acytostelium subglobosum LB1]|eukprot:XP_012755719.1 hypothetical protein SAMD00019534_047750 [Acytostelium subglobosum LB1]